MNCHAQITPPSYFTKKALATLHNAHVLLMGAVAAAKDKEQAKELATRLGEVSYTIKKLEAME